jgi:hypothetical protein
MSCDIGDSLAVVVAGLIKDTVRDVQAKGDDSIVSVDSRINRRDPRQIERCWIINGSAWRTMAQYGRNMSGVSQCFWIYSWPIDEKSPTLGC